MIFFIFHWVTLGIMVFSILNRWSYLNILGFILMFLGTRFIQYPIEMHSIENLRLTKFIATMIFTLGGTIIYIKESSEIVRKISILQLLLLGLIYVTWYFKLPGSHPAALVNVLLTFYLFSKLKKQTLPYILTFIVIAMAVTVEFILRISVFIKTDLFQLCN